MSAGPVAVAPEADAAVRAPEPRAPSRAPEPVPAARGAPAGRAAAAAETPTTLEGAMSFLLQLGAEQIEIALEGQGVRVTRSEIRVDLAARGLGLPGLRLTSLTLRRGADGLPSGGSLAGDISAPFVQGSAHLDVDAQGNLSGGGHGTFAVAVLGNPQVTFNYEQRRWSGGVTIEGRNLRLPISNVVVDEGRATVSFAGDQLTGKLDATFHHAALGNGRIGVTLSNRGVEGTGGFDLTIPLLQGSHGDFSFVDNRLSANLALTAAAVRTPIPGFSLTNLNGNIALADGQVSGTFGLTAAYQGLATLTLANVGVGPRGFTGAHGTIDVTAPAIAGSRGAFDLDARGRPSGTLTIQSDRIPIPALRRGSITITLRPDGGVDLAGAGQVEIGPATGDFTASYENGVLGLDVGARVTVPPLQPIVLNLHYLDGDLRGDVTTGVTIGPLSGNVLLRYANHEFGGEGTLRYVMGRFDGSVHIVVDALGHISGDGTATFRLADWLQATIGLIVHPDLNVDAHGELAFPSEVTLFPAWRFERNFFSFEQEFPLWGITVPVVGSIGLIASVHANAGFRAAFGPGTLRNIRATGDVSTRPDQEPAFTISGDFNIPAGAEVVLIVGGGIGLAALIAKIEGGIDLNGIAGLYGAITLTPTFAYRNGEYVLRGEALLAAAAQLRASINAYARVVAGIGWLSGEVWRKDWNLAEWRYDTGWHVGLKAGIDYVLGQPFEPDVKFEPVEVDPTSIIHAAIPNSGEPVPAPPQPPAPQAQFTAAEGEATAAATTQPGGGPPPAGGAGSAAPAGAGGSAPAAPGAPAPGAAPAPAPATPATSGGPAAPASPQAQPIVDPPPAESAVPEDRTAEEQYLVYVYDNLEQYFQRKPAATAPPPSELRRRARPRRRKIVEPPKLGEALSRVDAAAAAPSAAPAPTPDEPERSRGAPLAPAVRERMEQALATDLTGVRVHTDEAAREGARAIGAEAYASGDHVYMGPSRSPNAHPAVLAHELAHVAQGTAPTGEAVGRRGSEAEREAERVAAAVERGEQPEPPRRKRGAEIHRLETPTGSPGAPAAPGASPPAEAAGAQAGKGPHIQFSAEELRRILTTPGDPKFEAALKQIESHDKVLERVRKEVYDTDIAKWRARESVDMRFPVATALPHRGVYGHTQVVLGDVWIIHGQSRETDVDTPQGLMASAIRQAGEAQGFGTHPQGEWDREGQFPVYLRDRDRQGQPLPDEDLTQPTPEALNRKPGDAGPKTNSQAHNLRLNAIGYAAMWDAGWAYHGGVWWRQEGPGSQADAEMKRQLQDYQAHHVVPVWLRSTTVNSGDVIENLAPWRADRHQINHATHHKVPPDVYAKTLVTDYRKFDVGTRFKIARFEEGVPSAPTPKATMTAPPPPYTWTEAEGPPLWWGE